MEYLEYIIKYTCSHFNRKWNLAQHFIEFYSFRALGNARTPTPITHQCL